MFGLPMKALALVVAMAAYSAPSIAQEKADDFVVTTLGTGTPSPVMDRMGASTLVDVAGKKLLFDAGRGVMIQLYAAKVPAGKLDAVFITHLHSDHVNGLPDLLLTGWLPSPFGGRTTPMQVFGPEGTLGLTDGLTQAYAWDIEHRILDQRLAPEGVQMNTKEVTSGVVWEEDGVKVTAIEVNHGEHLKTSLGYRIDYDGRSVTISGDTTADENLVKAASGTNLLFHQTASAKPELVATSPVWNLILAHHTTPAEAGDVFSKVSPDLAVLYHVVRLTNGKIPMPSFEEIVAEVKTNYSGELVVAEDMMSFSILADGVKLMR